MKLKNTKLREGDEVIVISGREKGKRGNIKKIVGDKCVVNDLNLAKKHTRPNPQLGITGGIVEKEMPINLSNVMIWNSSTKKQDKHLLHPSGGKGSERVKTTVRQTTRNTPKSKGVTITKPSRSTGNPLLDALQ